MIQYWMDGMFIVHVKLCSMYVRGDCGLSSSRFQFRFTVLKGCACCNLRLLRRELISYTGYRMKVWSLKLVVMNSVCVSRIYVHRNSDSHRQGRDFNVRSI